ncbi:MAG: sigma 54-interacting transcriptional regulator [Thermodesulfobacteriota bacterium]
MEPGDKELEKDKDFLTLLERTSKLIDDPDFQKEAQEYLYKKDRYAYENLVRERIYMLLSHNNSIQIILKETKHLASSFQYISPNFGDYMRCRYPEENNPFKAGHPDFNLSGVEEANIENLRTDRVALRELSLLYCDDLRGSLQVHFGSDKGNNNSKSIFNISHSIWKGLEAKLRGEYNKENFVEIIIGKDAEKLGEFVKDYNSLLEEFSNHLTNNSLVTKEKELRRLRLEDKSILLRVFLLTYCYSIMRKKQDAHENPKAFCHLIIPINLTNFPTKRFLNKISTYCGAFEEPVIDYNVRRLEYIFRQISARLLELEWVSIKTPRRINIAVLENLIRLCSEIQEEPPIELSECRDNLEDKLEKHIKKGRKYIDKEINDIYENFCTADPDILDILVRIKNVIPKDQEPGIIFFYSKPGSGKEKLAKICHLISPRSWNAKAINKQIKDSKLQVQKDYQSYLSFYNECDILNHGDKIKSRDWNKNKLRFNFRTLNCAQITEEILWGDDTNPGEFMKAHMFFGTLFLDEIDKIQKELVDQLLRVLESPREIYPKKGLSPIKVNLLLVFASNKSLDELERDGFSSAFISRVDRFYFPIPPLRERKEDIPLLINHFLREHNKKKKVEAKKKKESPRIIRYIDIKGLKLLMNLRWDYNIRALDSFINDLCRLKELKDSKQESYEKITYEEILDCLINRGLLNA